MAPRRRRLDAHADGDRQGARAERRPRSPAAHHRDAGRRLPRPRQAGDDGGHRRTHPLAESRRGRRRADAQPARSAEHPHDRRLRRARAGRRPGGAPPEAGHVPQGGATSATARSAGWRRRSTSSCSRASRAPTASAAPATSTARRWTGSSSARARSASSIGRRRRCSWAGTCWSSGSRRDRGSARS